MIDSFNEINRLNFQIHQRQSELSDIRRSRQNPRNSFQRRRSQTQRSFQRSSQDQMNRQLQQYFNNPNENGGLRSSQQTENFRRQVMRALHFLRTVRLIQNEQMIEYHQPILNAALANLNNQFLRNLNQLQRIQNELQQRRTQGLLQDQIDNLPFFVYDKNSNITEKNPNTQSEDEECIICLEEFMDQQEIKTLPCVHNFHKICIDKWLLIQNNCPLCKSKVL